MADRDINIGAMLGGLLAFSNGLRWLSSKDKSYEPLQFLCGRLALIAFTVFGYKVGDIAYLLVERGLGAAIRVLEAPY